MARRAGIGGRDKRRAGLSASATEEWSGLGGNAGEGGERGGAGGGEVNMEVPVCGSAVAVGVSGSCDARASCRGTDMGPVLHVRRDLRAGVEACRARPCSARPTFKHGEAARQDLFTRTASYDQSY
ncbi:hypothetical protein E2C01_051533 [Portunus trituberculatus]|uniref:Uncharacterized protein n=1 Tax=Portunus trituberculatus TaxID=210409 RepID=A0A5B7GB86_PORTR|nr:hypothetical protein [Portunus trituberculatus]